MRKIFGVSIGIVLLLAACGGDDDQNSSSTQPPAPTMIPTYNFVQPTALPALATAGAATAAAAVNTSTDIDPAKAELGRGRYEALECGACHGENGEGTDDGSALTSFEMTEADFISFMRSGGDLGSDHQFATNRLSDSGGKIFTSIYVL